MKKKESSSDTNINGEKPKQKERHIVSWSPEEDDILREQIRVHGTENWTIIASKFKDKTTRQCRRRWFTYLNSDFKKGGWSPEEDMLLCEAQKIFGNRWTEIAKVVSGRTDNAVKNRFTTLCKKRAKHEALAKENNTTTYINLNNKRVIFPTGLSTDGGSESVAPLKKIRTYISNTTDNCDEEKLDAKRGLVDQLLRPPFAVLAENARSCEVDFPSQLKVNHVMEASVDGSTNNQIQGTFLKKDDPKVLALIQQAELLSSLAIKVNSEKTDQSLESAWMVLQDFLKQNKENELLAFRNSDTDNVQLEQFKELMEDLRSSNEGGGPSWKDVDMYESSPASSEYSTGSTLLSNTKMDECQADTCLLNQEAGCVIQSDQLDDLRKENGIQQGESSNEEKNMLTCCDEGIIENNSRGVCEYSSSEFSSPLHVTPFFRTLAAAIPSPNFSESEKHFLMKTLGMDSTSQSTNPPQPPPCKRSLLHCL